MVSNLDRGSCVSPVVLCCGAEMKASRVGLLVEKVRGALSSAEVSEGVFSLASTMGKFPTCLCHQSNWTWLN